jgi:hypothetical protein
VKYTIYDLKNHRVAESDDPKNAIVAFFIPLLAAWKKAGKTNKAAVMPAFDNSVPILVGKIVPSDTAEDDVETILTTKPSVVITGLLQSEFAQYGPIPPACSTAITVQ